MISSQVLATLGDARLRHLIHFLMKLGRHNRELKCALFKLCVNRIRQMVFSVMWKYKINDEKVSVWKVTWQIFTITQQLGLILWHGWPHFRESHFCLSLPRCSALMQNTVWFLFLLACPAISYKQILQALFSCASHKLIYYSYVNWHLYIPRYRWAFIVQVIILKSFKISNYKSLLVVLNSMSSNNNSNKKDVDKLIWMAYRAEGREFITKLLPENS